MKDINSIYKHLTSSETYGYANGGEVGSAEYNRETESAIYSDPRWKDRQGAEIFGRKTKVSPHLSKAWNENLEFWGELPGMLGGLVSDKLSYDITAFDEAQEASQQKIFRNAELAYEILRDKGFSKEEAIQRIRSSFGADDRLAGWVADPLAAAGAIGKNSKRSCQRCSNRSRQTSR